MSETRRTRLAVRADLPAVLAIENHAIVHTAANFNTAERSIEECMAEWQVTHERHPWLVAEAGGAVLGFARGSAYKGRCAYGWTVEVTVYVHHDHHRRGVGRALYAALLPILRAQGFHTAIGTIALPNPASVGLHEAFGFRHVGTFERVGWKLGRWHDVGHWELFLQDGAHPPTPLRRVGEVVKT